MSTPKILGQVASCGICPNYVYYSGGVHRCRLVDETVRDKEIVAPFCPLPDYPSRMISGMQATILGLREPNKYDFGIALLTHVATKLKLDLHAHGSGITILLMDERKVYLGLDYITEVRLRPFEITFANEEGKFKLSPDADPPVLSEAAGADGNLWHHHNLR
jgi:hypothetical protein